jgi:hypothetical protein
VHVDLVAAATAGELGDVALRRLGSLAGRDGERLLDGTPAQVYGRDSLVLGLAQVPQQVIERQPCKCALIRACLGKRFTCRLECCTLRCLPLLLASAALAVSRKT